MTVEVGPDKTAFKIHKDLLVFYSDYFRGAFNGSFQEAVEGKLSLPDECVFVSRPVNITDNHTHRPRHKHTEPMQSTEEAENKT